MIKQIQDIASLIEEIDTRINLEKGKRRYFNPQKSRIERLTYKKDEKKKVNSLSAMMFYSPFLIKNKQFLTRFEVLDFLKSLVPWNDKLIKAMADTTRNEIYRILEAEIEDFFDANYRKIVPLYIVHEKDVIEVIVELGVNKEDLLVLDVEQFFTFKELVLSKMKVDLKETLSLPSEKEIAFEKCLLLMNYSHEIEREYVGALTGYIVNLIETESEYLDSFIDSFKKYNYQGFTENFMNYRGLDVENMINYYPTWNKIVHSNESIGFLRKLFDYIHKNLGRMKKEIIEEKDNTNLTYFSKYRELYNTLIKYVD